MFSLFPIVDTACKTELNCVDPVPPALLSCVQLMNRVHGIWKWHLRFFTFYNNPQNFKRYLEGRFIFEWAFGQKELARFGAQFVLILRRIVDCSKQKFCLANSWKEWKDAVFGKYQLHYNPKPLRSNSFLVIFFGEAGAHSIHLHTYQLAHRIKKITKKSFLMLKEMFVLSMRYLDLMELFSLDPKIREQATHECFYHLEDLIDGLCQQRDTVIDELNKHKRVVHLLLKAFGSKSPPEDFIQRVEGAITKTAHLYQGFVKTREKVENSFKVGLSTFFQTNFGWIPAFALPEKSR